MMWGGWDVAPTMWIVGMVLLLLAAGCGAAVAVVVVTRRAGTRASRRAPDRAPGILDERLAAGEIDLAEYERLRAVLHNGSGRDGC